MNLKNTIRRGMTLSVAALLLLTAAGCGGKQENTDGPRTGDVPQTKESSTIQFFASTPAIPDSQEWREGAAGAALTYAQTLVPDIAFTYQNFTSDNSQGVTYDEACTQRIRDNVGDDILLLNSDVITNMGREGLLADLSDVEGADSLLPAVRAAVMVDGKLVAFPREYVAYGLIVNNDLLKEHGLEMPQTIEDFFACCEKLKADGMEIPMQANRWWLECFVLAQGFADFYQSDNMEQLIADLNDGTTKMSEYMRPGFEFLKTCIDKGYINAELAGSYEAWDERDAFLNHESAFMTSFTGAVTGEGRKLNVYDFDLRVAGFPTKDGQVAVATATGLSIPAVDEKMDIAKRALGAMVSAEASQIFCERSGNFVARSDVHTDMEGLPVLADFMDDITAGRMVAASNPSINMELWGNTCVVVRDLLAGRSVDACMATIDRLQADANAAAKN